MLSAKRLPDEAGLSGLITFDIITLKTGLSSTKTPPLDKSGVLLKRLSPTEFIRCYLIFTEGTNSLSQCKYIIPMDLVD